MTIVTGASRGIGAAVARALAVGGHNVAVNFISDKAAAQRVVEELRGLGAQALAIRADVSNEDDVLRLFQSAEAALGPVQALVNNAGVTGGFARVENVDSAALSRMLA